MGRYFLSKANRADTIKAIEFFEAAVAKDADYAEAYAGLAAAYNRLGSVFIAGRSPANTRMLAVRAATRAIELDHDLAEAYAAFGDTMLHELDWVQAEKALTHAVRVNPSHAGAAVVMPAIWSRAAAARRPSRKRAVPLRSTRYRWARGTRWPGCSTSIMNTTLRYVSWKRLFGMDPSYAFGRWRLGQVKIVARQFEDAARELELQRTTPGALPLSWACSPWRMQASDAMLRHSGWSTN